MDHLSPAEIANHLLQARRSQVAWDPAATAPIPLDQVYAVHDLVTDQLGRAIGAWKTSPLEDPAAPFAGPIYANDIHASGAEIPASSLFVIGIEGEIAFRLNRDLPARARPYDRTDILAAIAEMVPLIEVVDSRMVNGMAQDPSLKMADNQSNAGVVVGKGVAGWETVDATTAAVHLTVNGTAVYTGTSNSPIDDLFALVAGTVNVCAARNRPVRAGDIITTGSCTGLIFIEPGSLVNLEFPGMGQVTVSFPTD